MLTTDMIPAWLVAVVMICTGIIWLVTRNSAIRMDSRIIAYTLILEGLVYGILFQFFNVNVEIRGFFSRLMVLVLCLSQLLPMSISYIRSINRGMDSK